MFEIVLLIVAAGGIAAYARGRGGNPIVWGSLGVGGYVFIEYLGPIIVASLGSPLDSDSRLYLLVVAAAWLGVIAFCARFLLGRTPRKTVRDVVLPQLQVSQPTVRRSLRSLSATLRQTYANRVTS